jgi:hypothetical protein
MSKKEFRTCQYLEQSGCWFCAMFEKCEKLEKGKPFSEFQPLAQCKEYIPALNPPTDEGDYVQDVYSSE